MLEAVLQQSIPQLPPQAAAVLGLIATALAAYYGGKKKGKKILEVEQELREFLRNEGIFPSPNTREISEKEVERYLKQAIPKYDGTGVPIRVRLTDNRYLAPMDQSQMERAKRLNPFEYLPYRPALFDSDNYAAAYSSFASFLWGTNTVGAVFDDTADHAYNVIIYADGTVEFYEPQDNQVVELSDEGDYQLDNGFVLL